MNSSEKYASLIEKVDSGMSKNHMSTDQFEDLDENEIEETQQVGEEVVGGGILAFPYAFYSTGLLSGLILIVIFVTLAGFSLHVLFLAAKRAPRKFRSYQDVMDHYMGPWMKKITEATIFVYNTGACIVFLTIIGDSITPVLNWMFGDESFFLSRQFVIIVFAGAFVYPVILLRKVEFLSYTSFFSILSVSYVVGMVIVTALIYLFGNGFPVGVTNHLVINTKKFGGVIPQGFMAMPVVAFAFNCHVITIPIYNELKNPTMARLDKIIIMTIAVVVTGYTCTGIFGFFMFGDNTDPDVLKSFGNDAFEALIGRGFMSLVATFSYPVLFFTARLSINTIFLNDKEMGSFLYTFVTTSIFLIVLVISMLISDISVVFGFVAAVCGVMLAVLFPAIIYLKLLILDKRKRRRSKWFNLKFIIPIIYFISALGMIVIGPTTTIFKLLEEGGLIKEEQH